jgi:hypothetical protein
MTQRKRGRWTLFGASLGVLSTLVLVLALGLLAGSGAAASGAPSNTSPPTISGTAQQGQSLHAEPGDWDGTTPIDFAYQWQRCDSNGGSCSDISGASSRDYTLTSADVDNTVRVVVTATNIDGTSTAASAPSSVVAGVSAPATTSPPTISGTPQLGQTLTANTGTWKGQAITFTYQWLRCDVNGASCLGIAGATGKTYTLVQPDVGHTIRLIVTAKNANGSTSATTVPTAVVSATSASGCPAGSRSLSVASVAPPARLTVDQMQFSPAAASKSTNTIVARFHVSVCGGASTQGALVYATAVPYNQFSNAPEVTTDASGWATITFQRRAGYPTSQHQQLIAFFVRARKPGENALGGISTRRLVSMPVAR